MQRWEYCSLDSASGPSGELMMLSADSINRIKIKQDKSKGDRYHLEACYRTIAKLGLDGWEMVGKENSHFFFKRPLQ